MLRGGTRLEFLLRRSLFGADAAGDDFCAGIILRANRCAGDSAKKSDLTDVRKGIRDRALKELIRRYAERRARR